MDLTSLFVLRAAAKLSKIKAITFMSLKVCFSLNIGSLLNLHGDKKHIAHKQFGRTEIFYCFQGVHRVFISLKFL